MDEPDRSRALWTFPAGLTEAESVKGFGDPVDLDPRFLAGLWPTWLNGRAE